MGFLNELAKSTIGTTIRAALINPLNTKEKVTFNATTSYNFNQPTETTQHAIEEGAPLTDNIRIKNFNLSLSVQLDQESINFVPSRFRISEGTIEERANRLRNWQLNKVLLNFQHENDVYINVYIYDLAETKEVNRSKVKIFDLNLVELRIATSETFGDFEKGLTDKANVAEAVQTQLDGFAGVA